MLVAYLGPCMWPLKFLAPPLLLNAAIIHLFIFSPDNSVSEFYIKTWFGLTLALRLKLLKPVTSVFTMHSMSFLFISPQRNTVLSWLSQHPLVVINQHATADEFLLLSPSVQINRAIFTTSHKSYVCLWILACTISSGLLYHHTHK